LAAGALRRACGTAPLFVRGGGSIPVVAEFAARRIPTIVTGFVVDGDHPHAADESFRLAALDQGERASHELYDALAYLP
jgi:acetylornithine deacetylase/succinyl-diaminopimelate desuccinylase-like protein